MWPAYAVTFLVAFGISFALSPLCARWGLRFGLADRPGGRRQHGRMMSRLGGIALYFGFVGAVIISQFLDVPRLDPNEPRRLLGLLVGTTVVFLFGLADDRWELKPGPQYLAQALAAAVGMAGLIFIEYVNNPLAGSPDARISFPWWLTIGVTLFWMMGMMQTVNWLDGLDGLAAGVTAIAALVLFVHSGFRLQPPQQSVSLLPLALAGACLGFLPFNFHPARVFMGGGAYVLGYALGALAIIGGAKVATVLLVMGIPILDVAVLIVWRRLRGGRVDMGDRHHLHFRLHDMGFSQRSVVFGYYVFSAAFGVLALLLPARQYKLLALAVLAVAALGIYVFTARRAAHQQAGPPPR
mgnify:FL=1